MRRRRRARRLGGAAWAATAVLVAAVVASLAVAQTRANTVTARRIGMESSVTSANTLKPASCNAVTVTAKLAGTGTITGGAAGELIVASAIVDVIDGAGGNDCVLAGGGNDLSIRGGAGIDVCIGGPGTDTFHSSCETQIQ